MQLLRLLPVVAATFGVIKATDSTTDLQALAAEMPPCALQCMMLSIEASGCPIKNQTCLCTNPVLQSKMTTCTKEQCTIRESLTTKNITSTACHAPVRNRERIIPIAGIVGGALALLAFLLRMASRLSYFGSVAGWDDLAMTLTMLLVIPLSALSVVLANLGLGKDIWTVPFKNITQILHVYFFSEWLYVSILPLTKISILLFYLRVFPRRGFRIATYVVIGLNVAYLITFVVISVFQCSPIEGAWLRWDGTHYYTCNNENAQGWAAAGLNMILDIVTMVLPLRELYHLKMSLRKKVGVMFMFCLGIFVTLVSVIRLHSLVQFANSQNITWDYVPVGYWSTIEVDVGVICACLPAIRSLLRGRWPSIFGDTKQGTSSDFSRSRSTTAGSRVKDATWPRSRGYELYDDNKVPLVDMSNTLNEIRPGNGYL